MNGHLAIFARLTGFAGLTALVSARVYPSELPDNPTYPAIMYKCDRGPALRGAVSNPPYAADAVHILVYSKTRLEACAVAVQVRLALDRWRKATISGVQVDDCFFEGDVGSYDPSAKVHFVALDFKLHYRET
jgi:hypothetical protein